MIASVDPNQVFRRLCDVYGATYVVQPVSCNLCDGTLWVGPYGQQQQQQCFSREIRAKNNEAGKKKLGDQDSIAESRFV